MIYDFINDCHALNYQAGIFISAPALHRHHALLRLGHCIADWVTDLPPCGQTDLPDQQTCRSGTGDPPSLGFGAASAVVGVVEAAIARFEGKLEAVARGSFELLRENGELRALQKDGFFKFALDSLGAKADTCTLQLNHSGRVICWIRFNWIGPAFCGRLTGKKN
jgi:hypothetical protein